MDEQTRRDDLANARAEAAKARAAYLELRAAGVWSRKVRDAEEAWQFWSGKVAALSCVRL